MVDNFSMQSILEISKLSPSGNRYYGLDHSSLDSIASSLSSELKGREYLDVVVRDPTVAMMLTERVVADNQTSLSVVNTTHLSRADSATVIESSIDVAGESSKPLLAFTWALQYIPDECFSYIRRQPKYILGYQTAPSVIENHAKNLATMEGYGRLADDLITTARVGSNMPQGFDEDSLKEMAKSNSKITRDAWDRLSETLVDGEVLMVMNYLGWLFYNYSGENYFIDPVLGMAFASGR